MLAQKLHIHGTIQKTIGVINHSTVTFRSAAEVKRDTRWSARHKLRFKKKYHTKSGREKFMTIGCIIGTSKSYFFTHKAINHPKNSCNKI